MKLYYCVLAVLVLATPAAAQRQLDRADSLLSAGEYVQARQIVQEWQRANPYSAKVDASSRARAIYLNARLTEDAQAAQELYLTIALSYPTSEQAPDALLRLGQSLLAAHETRRALAYLDRLVTDYPTAANRSQALLWYAKAQTAAGNKSAACKTVSGALKSSDTSADVAAQLRGEEKVACRNAAPEAAAPVATRTAPPPPAQTETKAPPATTPAPATTTPSSAAEFALQAGAFRNVQSANAIVAQLKRKGFDARVAHVPDNELALVRIGRFTTRADAAAQAARVKAAGFSAIVVDDVKKEKK